MSDGYFNYNHVHMNDIAEALADVIKEWDSPAVHDQIVQDLIRHLRDNQPLEVVCTFTHK